MRIYLYIFVTALLFLGVTVTAANVFLPGFLSSTEFARSAVTELLSFIVTTAVVGSLSAAVIRYLDERRSRPLRAYAAGSIHASLSEALEHYVRLLRLGRPNRPDYRGMIATSGAVLYRAEVRSYWPLVKTYHDAVFAVDKAVKDLARFSAYFSIEMQDEIGTIYDALSSVSLGLELVRPLSQLHLNPTNPEVAIITDLSLQSAFLVKQRAFKADWQQVSVAVGGFEKAFPPPPPQVLVLFTAGDLIRHNQDVLERQGDHISTAFWMNEVALDLADDATTIIEQVTAGLIEEGSVYDATVFWETVPDEEAGLFARLPKEEIFAEQEGVYSYGAIVSFFPWHSSTVPKTKLRSLGLAEPTHDDFARCEAEQVCAATGIPADMVLAAFGRFPKRSSRIRDWSGPTDRPRLRRLKPPGAAAGGRRQPAPA